MLLGLLILQRMRPGWPAFSLLILCATAASFSHASGLAAWISLPIAATGIAGVSPSTICDALALGDGIVLDYFMLPITPHHLGPKRTQLSLSRALHEGFISPMLYLFRFQAVRFGTVTCWRYCSHYSARWC